MLILFLGRIPFTYLEDIQMRFVKNYGKVAPFAPAYAMNDEFSRVLHQQMEFYSSNPSADTLNRVRSEVGEASIPFTMRYKLNLHPTYRLREFIFTKKPQRHKCSITNTSCDTNEHI